MPPEPHGLFLKQTWLFELVNILLELVFSLHFGQFSASHKSQGSTELCLPELPHACGRGAHTRYQPLSSAIRNALVGLASTQLSSPTQQGMRSPLKSVLGLAAVPEAPRYPPLPLPTAPRVLQANS